MSKFFSVRALLLAAALASTVVLAAACGGDDDDSSSGDTPIATSPSGGTTAPSNGDVKDIEVLLQDNFFDPKELTVPVNTTVEIEVKNKGQAVHNMHILSKDKEGKDFTSAALVNPGEDDKFEVKFTKTGTYDFQCDYHVPDMVGKITVK